MPSVSYRRWLIARAAALDEVEAAHAAVGTSGRGGFATRQVNHAYALLLSAEFQGFCKDLHRECTEHLLTVIPVGLQDYVRKQFLLNRLLDRGNPNPGNIGADFARFGIKFWPAVTAAEPRAPDWQQLLERLNLWRNAIAHNDYDPARLGSRMVLTVAEVRSWRRACRRLAKVFDTVLYTYLSHTVGTPPW
jgi:hypothetical protein